jgi:hypothetical protein
MRWSEGKIRFWDVLRRLVDRMSELLNWETAKRTKLPISVEICDSVTQPHIVARLISMPASRNRATLCRNNGPCSQ